VQTALLTKENKALCRVLEEKFHVSAGYQIRIKGNCCSCNAVALYSGSAQFKSQEGHWLFWLKFPNCPSVLPDRYQNWAS